MAANATWGVHLYWTAKAQHEIDDADDDRVAEYSVSESLAKQLTWARDLEARGE